MEGLNTLTLRTFMRIIQEGGGETEVSPRAYKILCTPGSQVGTLVGRPTLTRVRMNFSQRDIQTLIDVVRREGVDPFMPPHKLSGSTRTELAQQGVVNEKHSKVQPHGTRVAIKALVGNLVLNGSPIALPEHTNLDMCWKALTKRAGHYKAIAVVENWEAFDAIHRLNLDLSAVQISLDQILVLYRGEKDLYKVSAAKDFLVRMRLPVYAITDFDPKGLSIAQSLPHFEAALYPREDVLTSLLYKQGSTERYSRHLPLVKQSLDASPHPSIQSAWTLMKAHQKGLPQERFVTRPLT